MAYKPVGADENGHFPPRVETAIRGTIAGEVSTPGTETATALDATYVTYVDAVTGLPLVGKHVIIKVDQALNEIADIVVEDI